MIDAGWLPQIAAATVANGAILAAAWVGGGWLTRGSPHGAVVGATPWSLDRFLASSILAPLLIVATVQGCGIGGLLDRPILVLAAGALLGAVVWAWARTSNRRDARRSRSEAAIHPVSEGAAPDTATGESRSVFVAAAAVLAGAIPLFADRIYLPPLAWDALTYHLHFAATWLQRGDLATTIPPTGDAAHTYYPLAGQMLLYWNLVCGSGDRWVVFSQLPFLFAGAAAVAAIAVRAGASGRVATLAALAWAGTPAVLRQSPEVMLDIVQAAFFVLALHFTLRSRSGDSSALLLGWLATALLVGLKYSGLLLAVPLLPILVMSALRGNKDGGIRFGALRLALCVLLLVGIGGYAYARNLSHWGNPLMPLRVSIGDWTLLPGTSLPAAYYGSGAPRLGWVELLASPRAILEMGFLFVPLLLVVLAGAVPVGAREPRDGDRRLLARICVAAFALSAVILPFREHRYFLPVTAAGFAAAAATCETWGRRSWWFRLLPAALILQVPITLAYAGKDWAILGPRPEHAAALGVFLVTAGAFAIARRGGARQRVGVPFGVRMGLVLAVPIVAACLAVSADRAYDRERYDRWSRYWGTRYEWEDRSRVREDYRDMAAAWRWIARATRGSPATVAYAGLNTPYPLTGGGFANRVVFAPRSGPPDGFLYRWGGGRRDPAQNADSLAWRGNVAALGAKYLCVFRLSIKGGGSGVFPPEDAWARRDPDRFSLAWASTWARIYAVRDGSEGRTEEPRRGSSNTRHDPD